MSDEPGDEVELAGDERFAAIQYPNSWDDI